METTDQSSICRRRPHRKTRTGCAECRRRRVKCDEAKPECAACVRHSHPCVYPSTAKFGPCLTPSSDHSTIESTSPVGHSDEPTVTAFTSSLLVPRHVEGQEASWSASDTFKLDDLALLHHWTLSSSVEIVKSPREDRYWQVVFPEIGFRHTFVMHGILSLAALHLAYKQPADRGRFVGIAAHHHNIALQGFQKEIRQISDENSNALFVSTSLNMLYVFGVLGPLCDDASSDIKSRVLGTEWIPMMRGVEAVLGPVYDRVALGPLSPLLGLGNWEDLDPDHQSAVGDEHFRSLQSLWTRSNDAETYDKALYLLRKTNAYMQQFQTMDDDSLSQWGYNKTWSGPFIWLHFVPEDYFELLRQRQPPALVIFAYLGTIFHDLNGYWFLEGWGRNIVTVINDLLGAYWNQWLAWPKEVVGNVS